VIPLSVMAVDLIKLLRPKHWIKNLLFLPAPLFFSFAFSWANVGRLALAIAAFCALSSAVYIVNDIADRERDRLHPKKRFRPIAAGKVNVRLAVMVAIVLFALGFALAMALNGKVLAAGVIYVLMNLAYSFYLKQVAILDVMIVAACYVIRVAAGAYAINVPLSHWIVLVTFFGSLLLAFGKRKHEMGLAGKQEHRRSAAEYTDRFIDQMLGLTAGITVVLYVFYTIDPETVKRFGSPKLVYTTPIVVFGVLRYFYLAYNRDEGGDPVQLAIEDRQLVLCLLVLAMSVAIIFLYGNHRLFT
jgi:4-hydroxybenzoate polyprenyltransferase